MVAGMTGRKEVVQRVEAIYKWLDEQIAANRTTAGECGVCGKCCDFENYDHRLFVTTPEMIYFRDKIGSKNLKQITTGRCSYQVEVSEMVSLSNHKCTVYAERFAGCRIFCCKGDAGFQSDLTEAVIKKFKALCDEFAIPYRYVDLPTALQSFTAPLRDALRQENAEDTENFSHKKTQKKQKAKPQMDTD
jgi:hypothetical protein